MKIMLRRLCSLATIIIGLTFVHSATFAVEPYYKDKVIRIVVGYSPGGAFDIYARVIARHIGKYIPGNPSVIVENMPGAGSLISANYLYRMAKPDGLTVGHFNGLLFLSQVFGQKEIVFDARKFEYIGVPTNEGVVFVLSKASGITSVEKWFNSEKPVRLGGMAMGNGSSDNAPRILKAALKLPIKVISGYKGSADIRLAVESGELDGICVMWDTIKSTWSKSVETGGATIVLQGTPKPFQELLNVPLAINFAKTDEARQLIEVGIHNPAEYTHPFVLPPGTSKEQTGILRKAFQKTMEDHEFLKEIGKAQYNVAPVTGGELQDKISKLFKLDPAFLAKLKEIIYSN
jgi:tripartite-type tricarboxylate transporter receptor subunit TctC